MLRRNGTDAQNTRTHGSRPRRALAAACALALAAELSFGGFGPDGIATLKRAFADTAFSSGSLNYRVLDADALTAEVSGAVGQDAELTVPTSVEHEGARYQVVAIGARAFEDDTALERIDIEGDLTGGGIGERAFSGCTSLKEVNFAEGAKLATDSKYKAAGIGNNAFADCTSLVSIVIPAITSAARKANAYADFATLNPGNTYIGTSESFLSGKAPYWHNDEGPVARWGLGSTVFSGCTALETVVFADGNANGAFAYWTASANEFLGCTNLESLVFEGQRAYWGNPQTSLQNNSYTNIWSEDYNNIEEPTTCLTVSYRAADGSLLERVSYKEGTPTADIQTGNVDAAAVFDGATVPAPGNGQVWELSGTQSRRSGLTESCDAYLVDADGLEAARLSATQMDALYLQADRNLSEPTSASSGSVFDPGRYLASTGTYDMAPLGSEDSPYFTYDATTGALDQELAAYDAAGNKIASTVDSDSYPCTMSFRAVTASVDSSTVQAAGAYQVTVKPRATSSYTGTLVEWILVKSRSGKVSERFGETPAATQAAAIASQDFSDAAYSVTIGTCDVAGALVASSYAGLVEGAVLYDAAGSSQGYGFKINRSTYKNGTVKDEDKTRRFSRTASSGAVTDAAAWAVAVYDKFAEDWAAVYRAANSSDETPPWQDTAVLIPAAHADELASAAAYSYAHKAPVFFTDSDGSVSAATAKRLQDFTRVVVIGTAEQLSDDALSQIARALGDTAEVSRLAGSDTSAGELSAAIAKSLVETGLSTYATTTVSDSYDPMDCIVALSRSGANGVTLATGSTDESKALARLLHERNADVTSIELYGREETWNATRLASSDYDGNAFAAIWSSDASFASILRKVVENPEHPEKGASSGSGSNANAKKAKTSSAAAKKASATASKKKSRSSSKSSAGSSSSTSASGAAGSSAATSTATATAASGSAASATDASARKSTGAAQASASDATATQASASTDAQATGSDADSSGSSLPWWARWVFIALIVCACGTVVPILRRCR